LGEDAAMTRIACLRILPDPDVGPDGPAACLRRVRQTMAAFLVSRWSRPRRFGEIAPGAFLLSDPTASRPDTGLLTDLAAALAGEPVTLALLEGGQEAATIFAALHPTDLRSVLSGLLVIEEMPGQLGRILPEGLLPVEPPEGRTPLRLILDTALPVAGEADPTNLRATG
jgi:hypothetical protein